jgi:hypothetical protein
MTDKGPARSRAPRRPASFGPAVAALVVSVTLFSLAAALALDGVPNSESGLFYAMGRVAGLPVRGVLVVSPGWLLVARLGGVGMLASLVAIVFVRKRLDRPEREA